MKWNDKLTGLKQLLVTGTALGTAVVFDVHLSKVAEVVVAENSFCLSVDWMSEESKVVASGSDGSLSVLDLETETVESSWSAHSYAHDRSPAEIWTVRCGELSNSHVLASGADDGILKLWDSRDFSHPLQSRKGAHNDSGVCCIEFDRTNDQALLTGGYDGFVRCWDMRHLKLPVFSSSQRQGGGLWRLQKRADQMIFAACMRGGFRVLSATDGNLLYKYSEAEDEHWEALAYGATWITDEYCAGCSFYDKKLRLFRAPTST